MPRIIDSSYKNLIGDKVREFRKKRKMSQQDVANMLEVYAVYICRGSISRIEDKSRTVTDIELMGLSKIFHVSINDFFT